MNLTQSFPPADALIEYLSGIDYKKHLNTFMDIVETICVFVAAVSYVLWQLVNTWYQNGGKEFLVNSYVKIRNFVQFAILWIREVGYPQVRKIVQDSVENARAWQDLVTV